MPVNATISKTFLGSAVADSLPGGSTGYDAGLSETGGTPVVNAIYLRHDGANRIMNTAYHFASYSGTYGGDYSIIADFAKLQSHGDSGNGMQIEENAFAGTPFATFFQVATGFGNSFANRRVIPASSMVRNNSGSEATPSAPVAGDVGASGDAVLGQAVKLRQRYLVPSSETEGGRRQVDAVFTYAYTT